MTKLSLQKEVNAVRPPRVKISYDVQVGNATEKKELPFVVGVVGDFAGDPTEKLDKLKNRKFIDVDRDNFNQVLSRMKPGLKLRVDNTLENDGSEIAVNLKFESMEDFKPARVIEQVQPLKELMAARQKLTELKAKVDLADDLEDHLKSLLQDPDKLKKAGEELHKE